MLEIAKARGHAEVVDLLIHRAAAWYGRRYAGDAQGRPVKRDDLNGLPWILVNRFVTISHRDFAGVKQMMADEPNGAIASGVNALGDVHGGAAGVGGSGEGGDCGGCSVCARARGA